MDSSIDVNNIVFIVNCKHRFTKYVVLTYFISGNNGQNENSNKQGDV